MMRASEALVRDLLPPRAQETHKGDYGRVMCVCGAHGYTGAAYFAAQSAVLSGAGLVDLVVPQPIYAIEAVKLNEAMVFAAEANSTGTFGRGAIPAVLARLRMADAVVVGCGLGRNDEVEELVCAILDAADVPLVVDADGINALGAHKDRLAAKKADYILTPHDGELRRFLGEDPVRPGETRAEAARRIAQTLGVTLVMKGHETVTAAADGRVCVNTTGNAGMARGGSGDVLAGIIGALLAQKLPAFEAASAAVFLHGLAGDLARDTQGEIGMTPSDMLRLIPTAFYRCRGI